MIQYPPVSEMIKIGTSMFEELTFVKQYVVQCFPPHYHILDFFIQKYGEGIWKYMEKATYSDTVAQVPFYHIIIQIKIKKNQ